VLPSKRRLPVTLAKKRSTAPSLEKSRRLTPRVLPTEIPRSKGYFPGEVNFRRADVLVIAKCGAAAPGAVQGIRERAARLNPLAEICTADLDIEVDGGEQLRGRRVLVIEDGPTVTHGGMAFGSRNLLRCR